jgi:hypothetical protein
MPRGELTWKIGMEEDVGEGRWRMEVEWFSGLRGSDVKIHFVQHPTGQARRGLCPTPHVDTQIHSSQSPRTKPCVTAVGEGQGKLRVSCTEWTLACDLARWLSRALAKQSEHWVTIVHAPPDHCPVPATPIVQLSSWNGTGNCPPTNPRHGDHSILLANSFTFKVTVGFQFNSELRGSPAVLLSKSLLFFSSTLTRQRSHSLPQGRPPFPSWSTPGCELGFDSWPL